MNNLETIHLQSFATEAELTAQHLDEYGGSSMFAGRRFTFRDAKKLHRLAEVVRAYIDGDRTYEARMERIRQIVEADFAKRASGGHSPSVPEGKTYVVNTPTRYRIGLYLEHLDKIRGQMQSGEIPSAEALGKTFADAVEFGDFVKTIRYLYVKCLKNKVTGKEYGLAMQCMHAGEKLEKGGAA